MVWSPRDPRDLSPITSGQLYEAWMAGKNARPPAGLPSVKEDQVRQWLWGVDWQNDFLDTVKGSLSVPNGLDALARFLQFAYDNAKQISGITASADDHPHPFMVFFPPLWYNDLKENPAPSGANGLTILTFDNIRKGIWMPRLPLENDKWQFRYVSRLEKAGKSLVIWPLHCLRGTWGSNQASAWIEFMYYWSGLRDSGFKLTPKGSFWGSEMYAPQEALIPSPWDPNAVLTFLFDELDGTPSPNGEPSRPADIIIPGGVAENFCLDEWVRSCIREFLRRGKDDIIKRLHFNRDFTAPIQFPGYEDGLRAQYAYYAQNGVVFEGNNPYAV